MQSRAGGDSPLTSVRSAPASAPGEDVPANMTRRRVSAMLFTAVFATAVPVQPALAQAAEPAARVIDFDWIDAVRSRPVPARLHWPANIALTSRVPLIVFSHGMGGSRQGYSYLGRY